MPSTVFIILVAILRVCEGGSRYQTVQTDHGAITGYNIPVPQSVVPDLDVIGRAVTVGVFLGIPYAKPPVGDLRFARTQPSAPWKDRTWNATYYRPPCIQKVAFLREFDFPNFTSTDLSEDCLYLNIFTPKFKNNGTKGQEQLPVMVWIHGGAYTYGSAMEYDGRVLSTYGVVVVTINYRVGVMGYLSTGDDFAPGNGGMLDQIEALRWIQKNINKFGGDPNKVTIFGQSSGGSTVSLHMFSPLTKGLFHGVIAQSGVATDTFALYRPPYKLLDTTKSLAAVVKCPVDDITAMINCLRKQPALSLAEASVQHPPMNGVWVPHVDGYYLLDIPENLLKKGEVHHTPIIAGSVTSETGADYVYVPGIKKGIDQVDLHKIYSKHSLRYMSHSDVMLQAIICQYGGRPNDPTGNRQRLFEFMSYYEYIAGIYRLANQYAKLNPAIWLYSYNYRSEQDTSPAYWGTHHAIELQYELGMPFISKFTQPWTWNSIWPGAINWTKSDENHSRFLMTTWTNFAKTLNPNFGIKQSPQWLPYKESNKAYLYIDKVNFLQYKQHPQDVEFWNVFVPKVLDGTQKPSDCPAKGSSIIGK